MSSTWPCGRGGAVEERLDRRGVHARPGVGDRELDRAEKSSESNSTPSGAGLVIVISGGVVSRKTVRVTGAPASSASDGSNVWHGSAVRSCTW